MLLTNSKEFAKVLESSMNKLERVFPCRSQR